MNQPTNDERMPNVDLNEIEDQARILHNIRNPRTPSDLPTPDHHAIAHMARRAACEQNETLVATLQIYRIQLASFERCLDALIARSARLETRIDTISERIKHRQP